MNHADHVGLLRGGIPGKGGVWADLGSGWGAFTLALAELIGPEGVIYSVDRDAHALGEQEDALKARFPGVAVHFIAADFTAPLPLPLLDGIVIANALHFVTPARQVEVVKSLRTYLRPGGRLIIVEYNVDRGNIWVPHPFSYTTWQTLAQRAGFSDTEKLAERPSHFLNAIYSAASR